MNKTRFTNCKCHYNCETQVWVCNTCENIKENKYKKLLEFVKETDFIDLPLEKLESLSAIPDDSYVRRQAEYVLSLKSLLREIGEI